MAKEFQEVLSAFISLALLAGLAFGLGWWWTSADPPGWGWGARASYRLLSAYEFVGGTHAAMDQLYLFELHHQYDSYRIDAERVRLCRLSYECLSTKLLDEEIRLSMWLLANEPLRGR